MEDDEEIEQSEEIVDESEEAEKRVAEEIKEIPSETLEELTTPQVQPENFVEASEFFETPTNGEFVAPILNSNIEAESLEEAAQNIPAAVPTPDITMPNTAPTSTSDYLTSPISQDYSEYESEAYRALRDNTSRGEARREETRFDPTRGMFADTANIASPVINPFTRRQEETPSIRNELEEFAEEQRKYRESIEEDRAPPFLRGRKKTKVF